MTAALRVALASSVEELGGVSRHLLDLASGLDAAGVTVWLDLPSRADSIREAAATRGLTVAGTPRTARVDIVHLHLADTFDRRALARMMLHKRRASIVVTEHLPHCDASDRHLPYGGGRWAAALKTAFKGAQFALADRTIVLSSSCLRFMARRYWAGLDRLRVVPNGIPEAASADRRSWGGSRVVAAGSLIAQKGFDVLVRAAAIGSSWTVDIFGEGPARGGLERLASELHAPVRLLGWCNPEEMAIERAAVVCIPSLWEALPYIALEAMSAAAPVVASRVDGLTDLVIDGETGVLVSPGDPVELAAAISSLVAEPDRAERLGRAGRQRAATTFSYEAMIEGVLRVYQELRRR